jgi:hypothetical protein
MTDKEIMNSYKQKTGKLTHFRSHKEKDNHVHSGPKTNYKHRAFSLKPKSESCAITKKTPYAL